MTASAATPDSLLRPPARVTDTPSAALTDETLLARFNAGERAALGELAARYERLLLGLALGIVGGRQDLALDAVQDTWLRVIRFATGFRKGSAVRTWLYRITINAAKDALGRSARSDPFRVGVHADLSPSAIEAAPGNEPSARVRAAVAELSDDRRLLVLLCYHHGLTHPQAAEVLGIPIGTLKSRLHAALTDLRERLGQEALT